MTDTAGASTVRDYVRSKPASEETYVQAERVVDMAVAAYPGPDPSTGTDDHGVKLYPRDFLTVATLMATAVLRNLDSEAKADTTADAYKARVA